MKYEIHSVHTRDGVRRSGSGDVKVKARGGRVRGVESEDSISCRLIVTFDDRRSMGMSTGLIGMSTKLMGISTGSVLKSCRHLNAFCISISPYDVFLIQLLFRYLFRYGELECDCLVRIHVIFRRCDAKVEFVLVIIPRRYHFRYLTVAATSIFYETG